MGRNLDPIWIDTFFCNGRKTTISNIRHPFGKLSLLFRIGYHDLHVDMNTKNHNMLPKMRSKQRNTDNVFSSSLGNNRQDLSKITHQGPRFSHQRYSRLHVHHAIASNHARSDQQLRKLGDVSLVPHPK